MLVPYVKAIQWNCQCICLTQMDLLIVQSVSALPWVPSKGPFPVVSISSPFKVPALAAEAAAATQFGTGAKDKRALGSVKCCVLPSCLPKCRQHSVRRRPDMGSNPCGVGESLTFPECQYSHLYDGVVIPASEDAVRMN